MGYVLKSRNRTCHISLFIKNRCRQKVNISWFTVEVFKKTLDLPQFKDFYAGIVLQAYLPDSFLWQKDLCDWARTRGENGGAPIKFRLVKGANMEMEETEASQKHWEMVTYVDKADTDSNYKRMARYALQKENAPFMHIGTASHNLFELAFSLIHCWICSSYKSILDSRSGSASFCF